MWDVFKDWIFDCIAFFANFLGDWGLAIIVITVIFRLLGWLRAHAHPDADLLGHVPNAA